MGSGGAASITLRLSGFGRVRRGWGRVREARFLIATAGAALMLALAGGAASASPQVSVRALRPVEQRQVAAGPPTLDSRLARLSDYFERKPWRATLKRGRQLGLVLRGRRVRVVIAAPARSSQQALRAVGGRLEARER